MAKYKLLVEERPDLLNEWDYEKNNKLGIYPDKLSYSSNLHVWWKCNKGHSWNTMVCTRTLDKCGCPICSNKKVLAGYNDLASQQPQLVEEWDFEKNGDLLPSQVVVSSQKKVWWKCKTCGHSWKTTIGSRSVNHTGCKKCKKVLFVSFPEQAIFYYFTKLLGNKEEVLNQFQFKDAEGSFEIDVFVPSIALAIEHDGEFWHKDKKEIDARKTERLHNLGIRLYRIKESNVNCVKDNEIFYDYHKNKFKNLIYAIEELTKLLGYKPIPFDIDKEYFNVLELSHKVKREKNFTVVHPEIAAEWNYEKNGNLDPKSFTVGSNAKVWWKCSKGHEWQAVIGIRCHQHTQCPICINHVILSGFNDLATTHPDLIKEWDYENNIDIKPTEISYGSHRLVWWVCKEGHHWEASPATRTGKKRGCPVCAKNNLICSVIKKQQKKDASNISIKHMKQQKEGISNIVVKHMKQRKENVSDIFVKHIKQIRYGSLAVVNPELAEEWDYEKNGNLKPTDVSYHSGQRVWWKCKKCGHSWKAIVDNRAKGRGCPKCINRVVDLGDNDVATLYPHLLKKWDYEKNKGLSLHGMHPGSPKNVWWKCDVCGHEFRAEIRNVVRYNGCAVCSGKIAKPGYNDVVTLYPEIMKNWDYAKNKVSPTTIRPGNYRTKYWWKSVKCGHEWDESIAGCIKREGKCPYCDGQRVLVGFNDIATKFPHLEKEWNYEKNGNLLPTQFTAGSNKIVWWKCSICGTEWKSAIVNRTGGSGCPSCRSKRASERMSIPKPGHSILEKFPELLKYWCYDKNNALGLFPDKISFSSDKKVWWKCINCGYEWLEPAYVRKKKHKCSHCKKQFIEEVNI